MSGRLRSAAPQLVITVSSAIPGSTPTYERNLRLGAIRVRREQAEDCRRDAMTAERWEDFRTAERFHSEADRAEARIERLTLEISEFSPNPKRTS